MLRFDIHIIPYCGIYRVLVVVWRGGGGLRSMHSHCALLPSTTQESLPPLQLQWLSHSVVSVVPSAAAGSPIITGVWRMTTMERRRKWPTGRKSSSLISCTEQLYESTGINIRSTPHAHTYTGPSQGLRIPNVLSPPTFPDLATPLISHSLVNRVSCCGLCLVSCGRLFSSTSQSRMCTRIWHAQMYL